MWCGCFFKLLLLVWAASDFVATLFAEEKHAVLTPYCDAQVMYYFMGKMMVLQPDGEHTFVRGEGDHPMLPPGPGLYTLRKPSLPSLVAAGARSGVAKVGADGAAKVPAPLCLCKPVGPPLLGFRRIAFLHGLTKPAAATLVGFDERPCGCLMRAAPRRLDSKCVGWDAGGHGAARPARRADAPGQHRAQARQRGPPQRRARAAAGRPGRARQA